MSRAACPSECFVDTQFTQTCRQSIGTFPFLFGTFPFLFGTLVFLVRARPFLVCA